MVGDGIFSGLFLEVVIIIIIIIIIIISFMLGIYTHIHIIIIWYTLRLYPFLLNTQRRIFNKVYAAVCVRGYLNDCMKPWTWYTDMSRG